MGHSLKLAVVGVGRIGIVHARHVQALSREGGECELVAVSDSYRDVAARVAAQLQPNQRGRIRAFTGVAELVAAGIADGAVIASRTENHCADARLLVDAGLRVMLEKPLTDSLDSAREFTAYLNGHAQRRHALMQAFMRRFDAPLRHAKAVLAQGHIGSAFKVVSVLEDPRPPHAGYKSAGLLPDMAVHNIDEINWLLGAVAERVIGTGSNLYSSRISPVREDFDDAFLQLWYPGGVVGQVTVSRNHVACYRTETWIYGDRGMIHVGRVQMNPLDVEFEAFDRDGRVIEKRSFALRDYGAQVPVFVTRFGPAYKAETAHYIDRCRRGEPFAVDQNDGLRAMVVVEAGQRALRTHADGVPVVS